MVNECIQYKYNEHCVQKINNCLDILDNVDD